MLFRHQHSLGHCIWDRQYHRHIYIRRGAGRAGLCLGLGGVYRRNNHRTLLSRIWFGYRLTQWQNSSTSSTASSSAAVASSTATTAQSTAVPSSIASTTPVPSSIASSTPVPESGNSNHTGAIVGGVIGGVAGLVLILGLVFFLFKRQRKSQSNVDDTLAKDDGESNPPYSNDKNANPVVGGSEQPPLPEMVGSGSFATEADGRATPSELDARPNVLPPVSELDGSEPAAELWILWCIVA